MHMYTHEHKHTHKHLINTNTVESCPQMPLTQSWCMVSANEDGQEEKRWHECLGLFFFWHVCVCVCDVVNVCVYQSVCVCACVCVRGGGYVQVSVYVCMQVCVCACVCGGMCVRVSVHVYVCVCMCVCVFGPSIGSRVDVATFHQGVCESVCLCARVCVCAFLCAANPSYQRRPSSLGWGKEMCMIPMNPHGVGRSTRPTSRPTSRWAAKAHRGIAKEQQRRLGRRNSKDASWEHVVQRCLYSADSQQPHLAIQNAFRAFHSDWNARDAPFE